jgi:hypothetical protein
MIVHDMTLLQKTIIFLRLHHSNFDTYPLLNIIKTICGHEHFSIIQTLEFKISIRSEKMEYEFTQENMELPFITRSMIIQFNFCYKRLY